MKVRLKLKKANSWSPDVDFYRNCFHDISSYFTRTGKRYTGLRRDEEEELGELLRKDLSPESPFWDNYFIRLGSKDVIIDTAGGPESKLKYLFLKNHKRVANNYNDRSKPSADYVLINEEADAEQENLKNRTKRKAFAELDKMSLQQMLKALRVYGYKSENISAEVAENTLNRLVENDPQKFLTIWVENVHKETHFLIESAVSKNIIRKNKTIYKYGSDVLGYTLEDAIDYLENPNNQDIKIAILTQLETKDEFYKGKESSKKKTTAKKTKKVTEEDDS